MVSFVDGDRSVAEAYNKHPGFGGRLRDQRVGLFTISCATCASRLTVRQLSAIDQVLSCPKCGSMVHVQPPEGWQPPAEEEFNAPAGAPATGGSQASPVTVRPATLARPAKPANDGPILPTGEWTSQKASQRSKSIAWVAGLIAVIVITLTLIVFLINRMVGSGQIASVENPSPANAIDNALASDPKNGDPLAPLDETQGGSNPETPNSGDAGINGQDPKGSDLGTSDSTDPGSGAQTGADPPETTTEQGIETTDSQTPPVAPSNAGADDGSSGKTVSPLPFDVAPAPSALTGNAGDQELMTNELGKIGELLFENISFDDFQELATDAPETMIAGTVHIPKPDPLAVDLQTLLGQPIPSIKQPKVSLLRFLRSFGRWSSIPIAVDPRPILERRLDLLQTVSVDLQEGSALEILEAALAPTNLTFQLVADEQVLLITTQDTGSYRQLYDLPSPLSSDAENLDSITKLVQKYIAPATWIANGGPGIAEIDGNKLAIEQTASEHAQVQHLLKLLSAAKTLQSQPADADAQATVESILSRSDVLLAGEVTDKMIHGELLTSFLDRVQLDSGLAVLVDWAAVQPLGWTPQTEIPWHFIDTDIRGTLSDIALSMGLRELMLDENTMLFTTRWNVDHTTRVEVYPCGELLASNVTPERILDLLRVGIGSSLPAPQNAFTYVDFEPEFQCVVAVLPDALHLRAERIIKTIAASTQPNVVGN